MTCPSTETLTQHALNPEANPELGDHLAGCPACRSRVTATTEALEQLTAHTSGLASETPASLEARLRFGLRDDTARAPHGATTLRPGATEGGARGWFARHPVYSLAASAVAVVALILVTLVAAPTERVSAADVLERSHSTLFDPLTAGDGQRIVYRISYDGPDFGALPGGLGELVLEEVWDYRTDGNGVRVTLGTTDGMLLRGFRQTRDSRRVVAHTPWGVVDMKLTLEGDSGDVAALDIRRRQLGEALFGLFMRSASPDRVSHVEDTFEHIVELAARTGGTGTDALSDIIELQQARMVVERDSYRLKSAILEGTLLGEPFRIDAGVESLDALTGTELDDFDFALPEVEAAIELTGSGTRRPLADLVRLLLSHQSAISDAAGAAH